jgi:restriction system protein
MAEEHPIWGIHMNRDFGTRPISEGFVAIGWKAMGDLSALPPNREQESSLFNLSQRETRRGPCDSGDLV